MSRRRPSRDVYDTYERDRYNHHHRHEHVEEDVDYQRRGSHQPRVRELERISDRGHSPPDFLRERYRRSSSAGPMVVRSRLRGDYEYMPREFQRKREEITLRRPRGKERRSPPKDIEIDEVTFRKRERSTHREPEVEYGRDEFIVRKERDYLQDQGFGQPRARDWPKNYERDRERDEYSSHRFAREEKTSRSRMDERDEIIFRRDERERGRRREEIERDEIIVRRREERSSSESSARTEPPPIRAPPIHQDIITHHRHLDHGYKIVPPPPPEPPLRRDEIDDIELQRRREEKGRSIEDEIIIDHESSHRREKDDIVIASRRRTSPGTVFKEDDEEVIISHTSRTQPHERKRDRDLVVIRDRDSNRDWRDAADIQEEADFYNRRATEDGSVREAYNGITRKWTIVDVPPGTKRVTMDGVGGASQEITWQRYNGVRRSKFITDGEEYVSDIERIRDRGRNGKRHTRIKDRREELWTEITKDLVTKEAIEKLGYDYEETDYFYYIIAYLRHNEVAELVSLSDELRRRRRKRIHEIEVEKIVEAPIAPLPPLLALDPPPSLFIERRSRPVLEEDRTFEREIVFGKGKPSRPRSLTRSHRW